MSATGWIPFAVTFSVNPAWFASPAEAYDFCRRFFGKFVEELRRRDGKGNCSVGGGGVRLHSGSYVCFFEPHKSGWPHWHLLLDAKYVDIEVLRRVWNSFGRRHGKGGIGHVFFTEQSELDPGDGDQLHHEVPHQTPRRRLAKVGTGES